MKRQISKIPHPEQMQIYNEYLSGLYFIKEIIKKHDITYHTFYEIIKNIKLLIKEKIYEQN